MKKKNEMLEKIQKQPSSRNISSRIVKATPTITPTEIISSKYAKEPLDIAKKATEFDKIADELADVLSTPSKVTKPNQIYNRAGKLIDLSKLGSSSIAALKLAGKIAGPLAVATDVMASDDLNANEEAELDREKNRAKMLSKMSPEERKKFEDIENKAKELALEPVTKDLIKPIVNNNESAISELKDDEDLSYVDYLKKRKKQLGYE